MQIASLWRFNEKFHPSWHPLYALYSAPEDLAASIAAVARAEAVTELPVVGRFLRPTPAA
jgi:lysyl-tRNA synthetase class 2